MTDVTAFDNSEQEILKISAALEGGSSHPLAIAILGRAAADKLDLPQATEAKAIGGKGVSGHVRNKEVFLGSPEAASERIELSQAQQTQIWELNASGKSVAVLIVDRALAGAIALRDEPRADAKAGLKALQEAGIKTLMLTGDNRKTAEAIGEQLGLEVHAQLLPEDKPRILKELKCKGLTVAKVGDGINDAPVFAEADVGIAMGAVPTSLSRRRMPLSFTAVSATLSL